MSETPTVEQVMERIRAQVRQQQAEKPPLRAPVSAQGSRHVAAAAPPPIAAPNLQEQFSRLHRERSAALAGHLQTGQLNPRRSGLHNDAVQFIKKTMRRSLTWYTRPLHLFQASVIRALEHVNIILLHQNAALNDQTAVLRQTAEQLQSQSTVLRQTAEQLQNQQNQLAALRHATEQVTPIRNEVTALAGQQRELERKLRDELQSEVEKASRNVAQQASRVDGLHAQLENVQQLLHQLTASSRAKERDFRRIRHSLETGNFAPPAPAAATPPMFPSEIRHENEFDYFLFEDHYRGGEADIRERQKAYLDLFRGRSDVVDIGCGRGEFLELLRNNNITARGVELGTDQYLLCREKGLDVVQEDLFTFLEAQPDGSLGGLFSAQVIEHMAASDQLRYVALAYQKCSPQSPVLFETVNPECVYALVHNFFLDPTHVRPVHPGTLKFAMESQGFRNVELRFSSPVSDRTIPRLTLNGGSETLQRFNAAMERVNELLYGPQDYAAIGWK